MTRFNGLQNNGTAGELSPRLKRTDMQKYGNGWRLLRNAYPIPQGSITRRPGTKFLIEAVGVCKLFPFVSSSSSVFNLEFSNNLITVLDKTGARATVVTTYTEAQQSQVSYAQYADLLFLAHSIHKPAVLIHTNATTWTLQDLTLIDGPYQAENTGPITITPSHTTGTGRTLVASAPLFYANMVGTSIRLKHKTATVGVVQWGWCTVTGYTDTTHLTVSIDADGPFYATTAADSYRLSEFDATRGWPSVVCFQENRAVYAANAANPITVFASQSNGYSSTELLFGPTKTDGTVTAEMAITIPCAADNNNTILWLCPGPTLCAGSTTAEWIIEAASSTEAWSATNNKATRQTTRGSKANTRGIRIETSVLYVQQKGKKLREFTFNFQKNAMQSGDMMLLADHIALDGIEELVYVQDPHSYLVARLTTGELRFMTYIGEEDVGGWSRQILGGNFDGGVPVVESISVVPDFDLGYDALWLVVKRTVAGSTVRYIEIMQPPFFQGVQSEAWYLDCAVQATGSDIMEVDDCEHLEGETLGVYRDGSPAPDQICDLSSVGLDRPADIALVGFKYDTRMTTLSMDWANAGKLGSVLGKKQKIAAIDIELYETGHGVNVGSDPDVLDPLETRFLSSQTDTPPPLFDGWLHIPVGGVYADEAVLYFQVDDPIPFTLLEYTPRGAVNEN